MKDKEMTFKEKLNVMEKFGLQKEWAKWELKQENEYFAVLPSFRFLKPISDHLEFHRGGCPQLPAHPRECLREP